MIFVVGFLWLALMPVISIAIQISPDAGLRNASSAIMRTTEGGFVPINMAFTTNRTLGTEISASERTRRLIPYVAFYSPSQTDFPINQQYVVQMQPPSKQQQQIHFPQPPPPPQKSQKQQQQHVHSPAAAASAIPIPTAYVHMKVPVNSQHHQQQQSHQNHHHSPQAVFQTIAYGGQHPPTQLKEKSKHAVVKVPQLQHAIVPPAAPGGGASQRILFPHSHKEESLAKHFHSQKINMTPFTPTNSVPGRFIPIVYTNEEQSNSINYKPTSAPSSIDLHEQQQQQQQNQQHLDQQLHLYNVLPSIGQTDEQHQHLQHLQSHSSGHKQQNQLTEEDYHHRHRPQGDIVVTIPASGAQVVGPSSQKSLSQIPQQDSRQHVQYVAISTQRPPSSPSYRIISDVPAEQTRHPHQQLHQHQQQQQQQQFSNADNLTPQQKYVNYLRQQLRYKQQQQLQEHQQHDKHNLQQPQPQYHIQQQSPAHLYSYDLATTVSPVHSPSSSSSTVSQYPLTTQQSVDVRPENHHNPNRFNEKYPQHSPINHVVYQHPEVITNPEHILHPKKQSHHRYSPPASHPQQSHQYASNPNKYIEYIIEDPKQEIEDHSTTEQQQRDQPHHQADGIRPPPMIVVGNAVPPPPPVEVVVSSPRPLYKNQPTLRLHAISPTPRPPTVIFVSPKSKPTPKLVKESTSTKDQQLLPDLKSLSLAEILRKLQESNHLPQTLTPDNIDNSIRTLIRILQNLKGSQTIVDDPPQHHEQNDYDDYHTSNNQDVASDDDEGTPAQQDISAPSTGGGGKPGPNSGRPGIDYPNLDSIPVTSFDCQQQRYKGFFGDPETNCQVWHYCDLNGGKASFLCPNGTIFSQIALTCDWWFNVKCATTPQLYVLNERLYKYILPFTPKFPEDYSGPLVDKYLALKFKEMEEKMSREKLKGRGGEDSVDGTEDSPVDSATHGPIEHGNTPRKKPDENDGLSGDILSTVGEQSSEKNLLIDEETGRIASRGSTGQGTEVEKSTETPTKELPLSQQPIVVSTSELPFSEQLEEDEPNSNDGSIMLATTGSGGVGGNKISVEKVEVIEIKSDGTSGHLIPERRFSPSDDT